MFIKKKSIHTLPLENWLFYIQNINKIDGFANHFHNLNLKYVEKIKGFNPKGIFVEHMIVVGFNNSFIHIVLSEEEDNNLSAHIHNVGDLKMILSTNEFYKKKGNGPNEKRA